MSGLRDGGEPTTRRDEQTTQETDEGTHDHAE